MKKILAHLRRNSIQRKLLTAVSVLIFVSSILIISLGHIRFSFDYSRQAAEDMQQLIEQVSLNVDTYLDELARLCLSPYYSTDIMEQLESEPATGQELLDKRREIENYLRQVMITPRKDILRVYIFSDAVYSCARTATAAFRRNTPGSHGIWTPYLQMTMYISPPIRKTSAVPPIWSFRWPSGFAA